MTQIVGFAGAPVNVVSKHFQSLFPDQILQTLDTESKEASKTHKVICLHRERGRISLGRRDPAVGENHYGQLKLQAD